MATRANRIVLRELRTLFNQGAIGDLTDGQLLERFATHDPEAAELAFAALVERHGPMVLRVCRSALRDRHDADDAFQATFLVLVQQARSLWIKDSLGPWLHRVAHRIATRARHGEVRRRQHEWRSAVIRPTSAREWDGGDDVAAMLHEEIDRLPDRLRIPIVICDLQGFTHEKAARHLGWAVGTVKSRLARAREILRGRLSRRGLGPYCGVLIAGKGSIAALRAVDIVLPASLAESTVGAATALAAGKAAEAISAPITILIALGLKTMFLNKLRLAFVTLFFFGAAAATTVVVLAQSGGRSNRMPVLPAKEPIPADSGRDRKSESAPAPGSVPTYITQSRAMIVTRLEEELAEARARLDRTLSKVRSPDDRAAAHARKTVDALDEVLGRIDAVLVDAVEAYPTMFDFSGGPTTASYKNQAKNASSDSTVGTSREFSVRQLEIELTRARERLRWAEDMFSRGYVAKSVVDQERLNVDRLTSLLDGKPTRLEPPDRQQLLNNMMRSQSNPGEVGMGGFGNNLPDGARRKGFDVRNENRQRQAAGSQRRNQSEQQQAGENQAQSQRQQQQQAGQSQQKPETQQEPKSQQTQAGQSQAQPQSQQESPGKSQAQPQSQSNSQRSGQSQAPGLPSSNKSGQSTNRSKQGGQERNDLDAAAEDNTPQSRKSGRDRDGSNSAGLDQNRPADNQSKQRSKDGQEGGRNSSANQDQNSQKENPANQPPEAGQNQKPQQ